MRKIHWVILLTVAALLSSCDICREREEGRFKFSDAQNRLIPYKKGNLVNFIDENGKSMDFKVAENKRSWNHCYTLNEEICSDYLLFEEKTIVLASMPDNLKINVWMYLINYNDIFGNPIWDNTCSVNISMTLDHEGEKYVYFKFGADQDGTVSADNIHESLEINHHIYHDVFEMNQTMEDAYHQQIPVQLFYNKDYGILLLKVDDKNFLMLNR